MTARYYAGNTLASFFRSATGVVESTTSGRFDSSFVSSAILLPAIGDYIETYPFIDAASTTTLWDHFEMYAGGSGSNHTVKSYYNSSGVEVVRIIMGVSVVDDIRVSYWNGSSFTVMGTSATAIGSSAIKRIDVKLTAGVSGTCDIYLAGAPFLSLSGMNAAVTNFAKVRTIAVSANTYISQCLGADFDTRDSRYMQGLANANGNYTAGTGSYTDINETVLDESTSITLTTSGNKKTFTKPSITVPAGYVIDAMHVSGRARVNGSITDGKLTIRSSSTDSSSSGRSYNSGYEPRGAYFANDPATATRFTQSGYNAAEFGLEAA